MPSNASLRMSPKIQLIVSEHESFGFNRRSKQYGIFRALMGRESPNERSGYFRIHYSVVLGVCVILIGVLSALMRKHRKVNPTNQP